MNEKRLATRVKHSHIFKRTIFQPTANTAKQMGRTKQTARGFYDMSTFKGSLRSIESKIEYTLLKLDKGVMKRTESFKLSARALRDHCRLMLEIRDLNTCPPSEVADKLSAELKPLEVSFKNANQPFASMKQKLLDEIAFLRAKELKPRPSIEELKAKIAEKQRDRDAKEMEAFEALIKARFSKYGDEYTVEIGNGPRVFIGSKGRNHWTRYNGKAAVFYDSDDASRTNDLCLKSAEDVPEILSKADW